MRHEFLSSMIGNAVDYTIETLAEPFIAALRAVVELHKPEQSCFDATCYCADTCTKCRVPYPCPTIQAIEKELE